ncbi:uncharacterized protein [Chironomus tepperi]|uniref:uncharacterized protein n=1 Tax=Chironomus tepperi TaxID=113505 RepID=UPI00391F0A5C
MDKLLLSLYFTILLTTLTVNSAPMPSSKIISTIEQQQQMRQKKYGHVVNSDNNNNNNSNNDNNDSIKTENAESNSRMQKANKNADRMAEYMGDDVEDVNDDVDRRPSSVYDRRDEIIGEMRQHRQNKMFGYFSFNPFAYTVPPYTQSLYYPPEFFDDFASYYGFNSDEEEIMSRQNPGSRRRPGTGNFKNSPIYYIRLPPTPYMFVPGLGYISQPPTYTPMPPPPPTISPFYNLPLDFISNGKPTNIYQWGSPAAQFTPQPQYVPQTPAYQPSYQRPQRPYQRPMNPYVQESKVTNLKGAFLFNGRPEEIYVLPPSSYNSIYPDPRFVSPYY